MAKVTMNEFLHYNRQTEPDKAAKADIWLAAIGLQEVDGLKPSEYLIRTAKQHIEGELSIYDVKARLDSYYRQPQKQPQERTEEADKVSARITELLSEQTFNLSIVEFLTIHCRLFQGIYPFAGQIRDYNFSNFYRKLVANSPLWRREYENDSGIFNQISA